MAKKNELNELLGTPKREEQVERVKSMIGLLQRRGWALTMFLDNGRLQYGVVGDPDPKEVLDALAMVRDSVLAGLAKQQEDVVELPDDFDVGPPPVGSEEEELLADSMG